MTKSKKQTRGQILSLAGAVAESEKITPEALENFLHVAAQTCHAFELRIKVAQFADDTARVKILQEDEQYERAKARRDYFSKQLASQFPAYKPTAVNLKDVERQVVVTDYLSVLRLKRDAQIQAQAAQALADDTERKMALQEMQRALKYQKYLEPRFRKFERELEKKANAVG